MKTNMHYGAPPAIFRYAAILRKNPTKAETKLWSYVRKIIWDSGLDDNIQSGFM